jgi:hypothetical protein
MFVELSYLISKIEFKELQLFAKKKSTRRRKRCDGDEKGNNILYQSIIFDGFVHPTP